MLAERAGVMLPDADDMILGCAHRSSMADPAYVHAEKHLLNNVFADIQASPSDLCRLDLEVSVAFAINARIRSEAMRAT